VTGQGLVHAGAVKKAASIDSSQSHMTTSSIQIFENGESYSTIALLLL
jgi:hypothetical protein